MTNIELENAIHLGLTVDEVRDDNKAEQLYEKLCDALDEAQASVFSGEAKVSYVVIEITPNKQNKAAA